MQPSHMPILRPIPIPSAEVPWYKAIGLWLTYQRQWEVVEDWHFALSDGTTVAIPRGYVFNGATVPRPLHWLVSPTGMFFIPSLLHDFGYEYDYLWVWTPAGLVKSTLGDQRDRRKVWDKLFARVAKQVSGARLLCDGVYAALRVAGWYAWSAQRKCQPTERIPELAARD